MSEEELHRQKWKSVRGAYRAHCTRDINKAKAIMETEIPDLVELEALLGRLSRRSTEISHMDQTIAMSYNDAKSIEEEVEEALQWNDDIEGSKLRIIRFLHSKEKEITPTVSPFQSNDLSESTTKHRVAINLPKLTLKPFSGDLLEWLAFWDGFSSAIHDNPELSNIDKMNYLNGLLKGEAARVIAGLPLSNDNYSKAVYLLCERFGRKQILINSYMDALCKIPPTSSDLKKLRAFYDSCENYIRGLETLGIKPELYGSLLIPILIKKIPEELRRTIFRSNPSADSSLNDLRAALCQELETREKSHIASSTSSRDLTKTAKYYERLMKLFLDHWRKEYLVNLREHHESKGSEMKKDQSAIPVEEVVLINDNLPHGSGNSLLLHE